MKIEVIATEPPEGIEEFGVDDSFAFVTTLLTAGRWRSKSIRRTAAFLSMLRRVPDRCSEKNR